MHPHDLGRSRRFHDLGLDEIRAPDPKPSLDLPQRVLAQVRLGLEALADQRVGRVRHVHAELFALLLHLDGTLDRGAPHVEVETYGADDAAGAPARVHADAHGHDDAFLCGYLGHHHLHLQPHAHDTLRVVGSRRRERSRAHDVRVADGLDLVDLILLPERVEALEDV